MNPHHRLGEPPDLAALYAAGALTDAEREEFEAHLAGGCTLCDAEVRQLDGVVVALAEAVEPVPPDARTRDALVRRVAATPRTAEPGLYIQRAGEGAWEETAVKGMFLRKLFVDQANNRMTALVRVAPNTSYPAHRHGGPEECLVLEGDLRLGSLILRSGDYQRSAAGTVHDVQRTHEGCLLLITSSLTDEIV